MNKKCTRCGNNKPIINFRLRINGGKNRLPWCNDCKRDYDRKKVAEKRKQLK